MDGLRTSKTVNGVKHEYYYVGNTLQYEKFGTTELWFFYDADGNPSGVRYKNGSTTTDYYFVCNWRGDVIRIYDGTGAVVANYNYDAWGSVISVTDANGAAITDSTHIANVNPLRYRGYYYDSETGLYYLQSRYYDPAVKRFINADSLVGANKDILGNNVFAYCSNNPVNYSDPTGHGIVKNAIKWISKKIIRPIIKKVKGKMGSKKNMTKTTGLNVSVAFGVDVSGSFGLTKDNKGNVGIVGTGCLGGGTPNASVSAFKTVTSAPDIYKQKGMSTQIGGSFTVMEIGVGGEYVYFQDKDGAYQGVTVLGGIGVSAIPAEIHGEEGFSVVYGFNVFDVLEGLYIKIMEW